MNTQKTDKQSISIFLKMLHGRHIQTISFVFLFVLSCTMLNCFVASEATAKCVVQTLCESDDISPHSNISVKNIDDLVSPSSDFFGEILEEEVEDEHKKESASFFAKKTESLLFSQLILPRLDAEPPFSGIPLFLKYCSLKLPS